MTMNKKDDSNESSYNSPDRNLTPNPNNPMNSSGSIIFRNKERIYDKLKFYKTWHHISITRATIIIGIVLVFGIAYGAANNFNFSSQTSKPSSKTSVKPPTYVSDSNGIKPNSSTSSPSPSQSSHKLTTSTEPSYSASPTSPTASKRYWIMSTGVYENMIAVPQVVSALQGSVIYVNDSFNATLPKAPTGIDVIPDVKYTSFAKMSAAISAKSISASFHTLGYDNEDWNETPANERLNPTQYYLQAAQLAHSNGYQFLATPGWIPGYTGVPTPGQTARPSAAQIDPAIASVTDILDIQAQLQQWQGNPQEYLQWVEPIAEAVRAANPNVIILSGLVARSSVSAEQMLALAKASEPYVQGWWLNCDTVSDYSTAQSFLEQLGP